MKGVEQLPNDVMITKIAPLLKFEDYLALRLVSKNMSDVFSHNEFWKSKLEEHYFSIRETEIPKVINYCEYFMQRKRLDEHFETILVEERIEEVMSMIAKEGKALLPGLLKITERDELFNLGLIYDAEQCIKIILGLEKIKLQRIKGKDKSVIDLLDMLEIEFVLDKTKDSFRNIVGWLIDKAIGDLKNTGFPKLIREGKASEAVERVISKYFEILQKVKEWKNRWKKNANVWDTFITDEPFQYTVVRNICLSFGIIEKSGYQDFLEVTEPFSNKILYFEVDFPKFEYRILKKAGMFSSHHINEMILANFLLSSKMYQKLQNLEIICSEFNNCFKNASFEIKHTREILSDLSKHKNAEGSMVSRVIRNNSFRCLIDQIEIDPTLEGKWLDKSMANPNTFLTIGDVVKGENQGEVLIVFGYGFRDQSEENVQKNAGISLSLQQTKENYYKFAMLSKRGVILEMKNCHTSRFVRNEDIHMLRSFCSIELLGAYFSRYDLRCRKFVPRRSFTGISKI